MPHNPLNIPPLQGWFDVVAIRSWAFSYYIAGFQPAELPVLKAPSWDSPA